MQAMENFCLYLYINIIQGITNFHYTTLPWILMNILNLPDISWNWNTGEEQSDPTMSSTVLYIYILENLLRVSIWISDMAHACKQHRNQMLLHLSGEAGEPNSIKPKQQSVTLDKVVTLNGDCRSSLLLGVLPGSLLALHRQPSFLPFPSSRPPSSLGGQFL